MDGRPSGRFMFILLRRDELPPAGRLPERWPRHVVTDLTPGGVVCLCGGVLFCSSSPQQLIIAEIGFWQNSAHC